MSPRPPVLDYGRPRRDEPARAGQREAPSATGRSPAWNSFLIALTSVTFGGLSAVIYRAIARSVVGLGPEGLLLYLCGAPLLLVGLKWAVITGSRWPVIAVVGGAVIGVLVGQVW